MSRLPSTGSRPEVHAAAYRHARNLLDSGIAPARVEDNLIARGLDEATAAQVVRSLSEANARSRQRPPSAGGICTMTVSGVVVCCLGGLLFIGNLTGLAPTMPYAGGIVMTIGIAIICAGQRS